MKGKLVLGTRGSDLARAQATLVAEALRDKWSDLTIEFKLIKTMGDDRSGDAGPVDVRAGRKGLFTSEIERALLQGDVDLAIHSAKDLPSELAMGTQIAAVLPRAPVDDLLVTLAECDFDSIPADGIVATGSVRRRHQVRWRRPELQVVDLSGNVPTRLRKLTKEKWHAIILARAGLERLELKTGSAPMDFEGTNFFASILPPDIFLPAGGQGVIAIQIRCEDDHSRMLLEAVNHLDTRLCLRAEREFLRLLNCDCNQPVGVMAVIDGNGMELRGQIFDSEAGAPRAAAVSGHFEDAEQLAAELMKKINA